MALQPEGKSPRQGGGAPSQKRLGCNKYIWNPHPTFDTTTSYCAEPPPPSPSAVHPLERLSGFRLLPARLLSYLPLQSTKISPPFPFADRSPQLAESTQSSYAAATPYRGKHKPTNPSASDPTRLAAKAQRGQHSVAPAGVAPATVPPPRQMARLPLLSLGPAAAAAAAAAAVVVGTFPASDRSAQSCSDPIEPPGTRWSPLGPPPLPPGLPRRTPRRRAEAARGAPSSARSAAEPRRAYRRCRASPGR